MASLEQAHAATYALTQEEMEALESNVAEFIPKLAARIELRTTQNFLAHFARLVPQMLHRHMAEQQVSQRNVDAFFSKWTQLNRDKHLQVADMYAKMYRQANPKASPEEVIDRVGRMTLMHFQIPIEQAAAAAAAGGNGRAAPPTPAPQPFVPAQGGPGAAPGNLVVEGEWDGLGGSYS